MAWQCGLPLPGPLPCPCPTPPSPPPAPQQSVFQGVRDLAGSRQFSLSSGVSLFPYLMRCLPPPCASDSLPQQRMHPRTEVQSLGGREGMVTSAPLGSPLQRGGDKPVSVFDTAQDIRYLGLSPGCTLGGNRRGLKSLGGVPWLWPGQPLLWWQLGSEPARKEIPTSLFISAV